MTKRGMEWEKDIARRFSPAAVVTAPSIAPLLPIFLAVLAHAMRRELRGMLHANIDNPPGHAHPHRAPQMPLHPADCCTVSTAVAVLALELLLLFSVLYGNLFSRVHLNPPPSSSSLPPPPPPPPRDDDEEDDDDFVSRSRSLSSSSQSLPPSPRLNPRPHPGRLFVLLLLSPPPPPASVPRPAKPRLPQTPLLEPRPPNRVGTPP